MGGTITVIRRVHIFARVDRGHLLAIIAGRRTVQGPLVAEIERSGGVTSPDRLHFQTLPGPLNGWQLADLGHCKAASQDCPT
jgi:hypothetical protein